VDRKENSEAFLLGPLGRELTRQAAQFCFDSPSGHFFGKRPCRFQCVSCPGKPVQAYLFLFHAWKYTAFPSKLTLPLYIVLKLVFNMSLKQVPELGVIIAAGGSGSRFGAQNKLLLKLQGVPVFIYSLREFSLLCPAGQIVLVAPKSSLADFEEALAKYFPGSSVLLIPGGESRTHSVLNGLRALPSAVRFVAVHDAARPFAAASVLLRCLEAARKHGAAIAAKRVTDTVKLASPEFFCADTLDRERLWTVETPQVFMREKLIFAYQRALDSGRFFTDDAGVFTSAGHNVFLLENLDFNLKITYPCDLKLAEAWLQSSQPHLPPD